MIKRVINTPNLSENARLQRKRKLETDPTSPSKRRRIEVSNIVYVLMKIFTRKYLSLDSVSAAG